LGIGRRLLRLMCKEREEAAGHRADKEGSNYI
jgi:hypothetical protein